MSFSRNGWAVCIHTANGAVSNVTLCQGDSSGGTVTYQGRFEILPLAGSYLLSESAELSSRTGGLSVCLAGPDGRVLDGAVAGLLTVASPVQVVIGSFVADGKKSPTLDQHLGNLFLMGFHLLPVHRRGVLNPLVVMEAWQILLARLTWAPNQAFLTSSHGNEVS
ncbi:AT-hook motif nuclear-localized protein 10-like [Phragmites australis]|uniref:AT-hook motif nuclear-localized protein 10-like n=1 Tax=Phragmites australis TaxID=29695 RepID=UPI002D784C5B|nr:AT-hook motif nuclear-localized protein 10-like [Phragmites australis]